MAMFGIIVSGRLVATDFQQINETQFLTTVVDADNINHIVIFLTGAVSFPEGTGGQVYFSWPDPNAPPNWQPLGHISNQKPSAIFKISSLKRLKELEENSNISTFGQQDICHNAQVGISIEPLANVNHDNSTNDANKYMTFAQKMLENFVNYALSYTVTQQQMELNPSASYVPTTTVQNWYTSFERRLVQNPNFWKT